MNTEQRLFLSAAADHIHGRETTVAEPCDFSLLLTYAGQHQLRGILFTQFKKYFEAHAELAPVAKQFSRAQDLDVMLYFKREMFLRAFRQQLSGIPFFMVKGVEIASFYPLPALRTMSDIDIVVKKEDRSQVDKILCGMGYTCENQGEREWEYFKDNCSVELHYDLIYDEAINQPELENFFGNIWEKVEQHDGTYSLDINLHFLYLLLHLRKHFMNSGVGFRQFLDIAVVIKQKENEMDWTFLREALNQTGLMRFAQICLSFCEEWFGVASPLEKVELSPEFIEEATAKIFADGVFGFNNEYNDKNLTINEMRASGKKKGSLFWSKLFPSYNEMLSGGSYSFIKGKPFLLPVAWVWRFLRVVFGKKGRSAEDLLQNTSVTREEVDRRIAELQRWGL